MRRLSRICGSFGWWCGLTVWTGGTSIWRAVDGFAFSAWVNFALCGVFLVTALRKLARDRAAKVKPMHALYPSGSGIPKRLPEREQLDPFIGFKTLRVVVDQGRLRFQGQTMAIYDLEATAECHNLRAAMAIVNSVVRHMGRQLGASNVMVHALEPTHDEATHASPDQNCSCGFYALAEPPGIWEYGAFRATVELYGTVIVAERGWRAERQRILKVEALRQCVVCDVEAVGFSTSADGQVIAVCEEHGALAYATPAELAGKIGTEVRWAA